MIFFSPTTIFSFILLLAVPLGWLLPASWGHENGVVENTQVFVILLTAVVAWRAYRWGSGSRESKKLFAYSIPLILLVAFRELSWGRVFYPNGYGGYLPLKALWYGKFVYPAVGMVIVIIFVIGYLQCLDKEILRWSKYGKFPIIDILLIFGGFFAADFVEHHTHGFFASYQDLFEELFELVMYCGVLSLFTNLGFNKLFQPDFRMDENLSESNITYL